MIGLRLGRLEIYGCREALAHLDDYLDRELSPRELQLVQQHLRICRECARKFAFEAAALDTLRDRLRRLAAPPELLASVTRALEEAEE